MNDQSPSRDDRMERIMSKENPRPWRKRMRLARSSRVAAGARYLRARIARARSNSPSEETRSMSCASTPLAFRSWRMRAAPYLRNSICVRSDAKRSSDNCFRFSRSTKRTSSASEDSAYRESLRSSSLRECSRRASSRNARARSSTGESGSSFKRRPYCAAAPFLRVGSCSTFLSSATSGTATGASTPAFSRIFCSISRAIA